MKSKGPRIFSWFVGHLFVLRMSLVWIAARCCFWFLLSPSPVSTKVYEWLLGQRCVVGAASTCFTDRVGCGMVVPEGWW